MCAMAASSVCLPPEWDQKQFESEPDRLFLLNNWHFQLRMRSLVRYFCEIERILRLCCGELRNPTWTWLRILPAPSIFQGCWQPCWSIEGWSRLIQPGSSYTPGLSTWKILS